MGGAAGSTTDIAALGTGDIVPGSVERSSLVLDATYDADLRISWGARTIWVDSTATIRNTSGGPIDRVELNTIAARLGAIRLQPVTVDGVGRARRRSATRRSSCRSAGSCRSAASTTVRVRFGATAADARCPGSNWLFTRANGIVDLYRWLPWVSRRIAFSRPNHGDPFVTPIEPVRSRSGS